MVKTNGKTGRLTWTLNEGTLIIKGNGTMPNYRNFKEPPWWVFHEIITTVIVEEGVTTIGDHAFCCCERLASVSIPNSVTSIGNNAFDGCEKLISITIPDSVTNIGSCVFTECWDLKSIVIPDSVTNIGYLAFEHCYSLKQIFVLSKDPPLIDKHIVVNDDHCTLYVPIGSKDKYAQAEGWKEFKNIQEDISKEELLKK